MFLSRSKMTGELSGKLNKIPWGNRQIKFTRIPPKGAAILVAALLEEVQKLSTVCHIFFYPFFKTFVPTSVKISDRVIFAFNFSYFSHLLRWVNRRLISSTYQRYHFSQEVLQQDTCLCYCTGGEKFSYLNSVSTLLLEVHNKYTIGQLVLCSPLSQGWGKRSNTAFLFYPQESTPVGSRTILVHFQAHKLRPLRNLWTKEDAFKEKIRFSETVNAFWTAKPMKPDS